MRIKRIHHLTAAVRDIERANATFEALFGASADEARAIDAFGIRSRDVHIGDDVLQVAEPLGPESPVRRFIERRGEGFYNLALEVEGLDAAVAELAERGVPVSEPIETAPGVRSAFIGMAATHGLSIQLLEITSAPNEAGGNEEAATPTAVEDATVPPMPALDLTPDEWSDVD